MTAFDDGLDDIYADGNLACDALYKARGDGAGLPVRVIVSDADRSDPISYTGAVVAGTFVEVRLSDVAAPAKTDTFAVGAVTYTVAAKPDVDRTTGVARCSCTKGNC